MQLKFYVICMIGIISILLARPVSASISPVYNPAQEDSIKKKAPDYANVNVYVTTEWGSSDKREGVDVYVKMEKGKAVELVMTKEKHEECTIRLISGVEVKIIDPKTGKVLKRYKP